jgi:DNA-binding Lrp family transcriptional regulator
VTHAIILVQAERTALPELGGQLADVPGVTEAYSITGEWDFAAILRLRQADDLAHVITEQLAQLPGIVKTQTLLAFEVYSRHDLDALFSIGE